ncbi:MAG: hypothetical protein PHF37_09105 [Phycisphaerae bacterium]|nr:hypothetical protein [Phycisphaerae bacterium]
MKIIEEDSLQLVVKHKLPWYLDMFLYPANGAGLTFIVITILFPPLLDFFARPMMRMSSYMGIIILLVYILFGGYVIWYLLECITDSSKGNWRAPEVFMNDPPQKGELVMQYITLAAAFAVCFWPAAVYYGLKISEKIARGEAEQAGWILWLLMLPGLYLFPMTFLAVTLFDSFDGLNPITIIKSIWRTFRHYTALAVFLTVFSTLAFLLISLFPGGVLWGLLKNALYIYFAMVYCHITGWFYWRHKHDLDW